jgi:hypothetical protein
MRIPRLGREFPPQSNRDIGILVADIGEEVNLGFALCAAVTAKRLIRPCWSSTLRNLSSISWSLSFRLWARMISRSQAWRELTSGRSH